MNCSLKRTRSLLCLDDVYREKQMLLNSDSSPRQMFDFQSQTRKLTSRNAKRKRQKWALYVIAGVWTIVIYDGGAWKITTGKWRVSLPLELIRESLPREGGRARKSQPSTAWFIKTLRFLASHHPRPNAGYVPISVIIKLSRHGYLHVTALPFIKMRSWAEFLAIRGVTYRLRGWIDGWMDL